MHEPPEQIRLPALLENVPVLLDFTRERLMERDMDDIAVSRLEMAVEELLVNVASYAYPGDPGEVELRFGGRDGALLIEIRDGGIPFNPLDRPEPDVGASLEDRDIGGLGIYFARKIADDIAYRFENGENVLILTVRTSRPE